MNTSVPTQDYAAYCRAWDGVTRKGYRHFNVDTWAAGHRYLSLAALRLSAEETTQLRSLTECFGPLMARAVDGILNDPEWWSALAWPWPAIELARQEPLHPSGVVSLYGRFDCLLDLERATWQVIEFNADTPSGGREANGLEPAVALLHAGARRLSTDLVRRLVNAIMARLRQHPRRVDLIGVVSSHRWIEDLAQARWLASVLNQAGQPALVGDVNDLTLERGRVLLRGRPIDALYRFYPIERMYRHAIFAPLFEAALDGRLLILNGLRGFLAQSKACLAWLWMNRSALDGVNRAIVERHLPPTLLARDPCAVELLPRAVVKHVNGREGDSVVFGNSLDASGWEARLLEGGYVVQRAVHSPLLHDVVVDDVRREVRCVDDRVACVGAFAIGGRFGGCYTRLDGPITSSRATFVATLCTR